MAAIPYHPSSTLDAPILHLADGEVVPISGIWTSEAVDLAGFTHFCLLYAVVGAGNHSRLILLSNDLVNWHDIQGTGEVVNATMNAGALPSLNRAFLCPSNGARYLQMRLTGNATNTLTVNATVSLVRRA